MIIDWTAAPEGTTHATIPSGDPRWYKLEGGKVFCWGLAAKEWMPSFFLTVDEIDNSGLRLYANGEQSELVMLREQRDALLAAIIPLLAMSECADETGYVEDCGFVDVDAVQQRARDAIALAEGTK